MDVGSWCNSGNGNMGWVVQCCSEINGYDSLNISASGSSKAPSIWRVLWRKIKKEKKKIFDYSTTSTVVFTYDPYSYAQNFDDQLQGFTCRADPDDLSRSFSARFAVPSRVFHKDGLLV
uniref:Uncharacterized protein n=1 Tax=Davidia involucrata TaxID=16924 RepID=A0A5B7BS56_DAVIN